MTSSYADIECAEFKSENYNNKQASIKLRVVPPLDLEECPLCFDKSELYDSDYCIEMVCKKCIDNMTDEFHEIYCSNELTVMGRKGTYYCLYGGGPEGGFFVSGDNCYDIERDWGTEFKITRHYANCHWSIRQFESRTEYLHIPN